MLSRLTRYIIALLDLLEAELHDFSSSLLRSGTSLALAVVGALLLGGAAAVFGWSLFLALRPVWGAAGAAAACAVLLLLCGAALLLVAGRRSRR